MLALVEPLCCWVFLRELIGKYAGLGKSVHPFLNLNVYPTILCQQVMEIVFDDDFVGNDVKAETHVHILGVQHGSVEIKVGQVDPKKNGTRHANGGVYEEFGSGEVKCKRSHPSMGIRCSRCNHMWPSCAWGLGIYE